MSPSPRPGTVRFEKPGRYRIVVQGRIDESWTDRLAGMKVTTKYVANGTPTSILTGHLRDQAQLSGVLNSLYELHMPILLVEHIEEEGDADAEPQDANE